MWAGEKAFLDGLNQFEKKGHSREDLMALPEVGERWKKLVRENIEEMRRIEVKWGWPSLSLFGPETNLQAYWLALHADQDTAFQEKCLLLAAKTLETKDTELSLFASLWDRVQVNKHKLQRYGTQGDCRGKGLWEPAPMEDPTHANARRRLMGLEPDRELYLEKKSRLLFGELMKQRSTPPSQRPVPRPFVMPWGKGQVIEEACYYGKYHEPCLQLLELADGSQSIRFCYYSEGTISKGAAHDSEG